MSLKADWKREIQMKISDPYYVKLSIIVAFSRIAKPILHHMVAGHTYNWPSRKDDTGSPAAQFSAMDNIVAVRQKVTKDQTRIGKTIKAVRQRLRPSAQDGGIS